MQVRGPVYDAQTSDGGAVGFNDDTTVGTGESIAYFWKAPAEEGLYLFRSQTMNSGEEEDAGEYGDVVPGYGYEEQNEEEEEDPDDIEAMMAREFAQGAEEDMESAMAEDGMITSAVMHASPDTLAAFDERQNMALPKPVKAE